MIQIATALPTVSAGSARPVLLAAKGGASNFALALSAMVVPGAASKGLVGDTKPAAVLLAGRQMVAEPGKDLPEIGLDLTTDEDAPEQDCDADDSAPDGDDVAFAWFALPAAPSPEAKPAGMTPVARKPSAMEKPAVEIPLPDCGAPIVAPVPEARKPATENLPAIEAQAAVETRAAVEAQAAVETRAAVEAQAAVETQAAADVPRASVASLESAPEVTQTPRPASGADRHGFRIPLAAFGAANIAAPQPAPGAEAPAPIRPSEPAPTPRGEASAAAPQPVHQPVAEPAQPLTTASLLAQSPVQSAAQPILSPLRRALSDSEQPVVTTAAAPSATALQQVSATPDAQQGTLDMRRQEWMGQMIDRIETMRDAAPVKETRISLVPDALGKVDISVRRDGDRVHVHFAAETQAARQILTDAQPRLTELAEARGVRLGQTSVDSGAGNANAQSGQRQDAAPRPQTPSAPASARGQVTTETDERIA